MLLGELWRIVTEGYGFLCKNGTITSIFDKE
jgi:hypothetical protein